MVIVPKGAELMVEAQFPNREIGFIIRAEVLVAPATEGRIKTYLPWLRARGRMPPLADQSSSDSDTLAIALQVQDFVED